MIDGLKLKGHIKMIKNGEVVVDKSNLIVNTGLNFVTDALVLASASPFTHVAVGTDSTTPSAGQTALGGELGRVAFTYVKNTTTVTITAVFPPGTATGVLQEAGVFNAPAAGIMFSRTTFGVVNKAPSDTITIIWTINAS